MAGHFCQHIFCIFSIRLSVTPLYDASRDNFCKIIHKILFSWFPKYVEMALFDTVSCPVKTNVNSSLLSLFSHTFHYYDCFWVVSFSLGFCFWVSYFVKIVCKYLPVWNFVFLFQIPFIMLVHFLWYFITRVMLFLVLSSLVVVLPYFLDLVLNRRNHLPWFLLLYPISKKCHCICKVVWHFCCNRFLTLNEWRSSSINVFLVFYVTSVCMLDRSYIFINMVGSTVLA